MQLKHYLTATTFLVSTLCLNVFSQGTFTQIHQILQTNCAGSSCHQSGGNPSFDVTLSEAALYAQLINGTPVNPAAVAKGDKLVTPGYVDRSFLLRKLAHGLNENNIHLALSAQEGANMPTGGSLTKPQIELFRQWILYGAPLTGSPADTAIINMYYSGKGKEDTYPLHAPPASGNGFQIYVGKVFVRPNFEDYYYIKHNPRLAGPIEIPKVTTLLPSSTHHMVIFKFQPGEANSYAEGLRPEAQSSHASVLDGIGTGPNLWDYELPQGTAYFWEQSTVLDLNLHIRNSLLDTVLACDLYFNIYTQTLGTATDFMLIRNYPVFSIAIPNDNVEHEFVEVANDTNETKYWKVWQLYGHTHKYGKDYDIFQRNADGSLGNQEYESWMSYEQGVNVGYHRYGVDATFRFYNDTLLQIDPRLGWIHRARYKNNSADTIYWGLTSDEEMMVMGFQYIYGDDLPALVSVNDVQKDDIKLSVFPNPVSNVIGFNYILEKPSDIRIEMSNVLGQTFSLLNQKAKPAGNYIEEVELDQRFAPGIYLVSFYTDKGVATRKIVIE